MGPQACREYLAAIAPRYRQADKDGKSKILDEICAVCAYQRKYATSGPGRRASACWIRRRRRAISN